MLEENYFKADIDSFMIYQCFIIFDKLKDRKQWFKNCVLWKLCSLVWIIWPISTPPHTHTHFCHWATILIFVQGIKIPFVISSENIALTYHDLNSEIQKIDRLILLTKRYGQSDTENFHEFENLFLQFEYAIPKWAVPKSDHLLCLEGKPCKGYQRWLT